MNMIQNYDLATFSGWMGYAQTLLADKPIWTGLKGLSGDLVVLVNGKLYGAPAHDEAHHLRYASGNWSHLFGPGKQETQCRIVVDLVTGKLVAAQEMTGLAYAAIYGDRLADLAESVIDVNEAHANLPDWSDELSVNVPSWVPSYKTLFLESREFVVGARAADRNPSFKGKYMVADGIDPDGYCIVGDDLAELVKEAYDVHYSEPQQGSMLTIADLYELDRRAWSGNGWTSDGDQGSAAALINPHFVRVPVTYGKLKAVRITHTAYVRLDCSELILVPEDSTDEDLAELANKRYEVIDGGDFTQDPHYWERGDFKITPVTEHVPEPQDANTVNSELTVTVYAVAVESESSGSVDWYDTEAKADAAFNEALVTFNKCPGERIRMFALAVTKGLTAAEVTAVVDGAMADESYVVLRQFITGEQAITGIAQRGSVVLDLVVKL